MMYPFLKLNDGAEIVHSEILDDGQVKVYVEKPDEKDCFHHMMCWLPSYEITDEEGLSKSEKVYYMEIIRSTSNLIMEFARNGGFENASGF